MLSQEALLKKIEISEGEWLRSEARWPAPVREPPPKKDESTRPPLWALLGGGVLIGVAVLVVVFLLALQPLRLSLWRCGSS